MKREREQQKTLSTIHCPLSTIPQCRRKARGQYFTPPIVARALIRIARALAGGRLPRGPVVDPSCGAGVFIEAALAERIRPERLWGADSDPTMPRRWEARGLLGRANDLRVVNALQWTGPPGGAALVVGNPPFGIHGDGEPIECRFARKFIDLARPGGLVALILPEGLLANQRTARLREELFRRARILAVIGLPEGMFRAEGAASRTAAMIARRRGDRDDEPDRKVLVSSPEYPRAPAELPAYLDCVLRAAERCGRGASAGSGPWILAPAAAWPGSRWDPGYWHPRWRNPLAGCRGPVRPLGEFIESITYGPIVTNARADPDALGCRRGIPVIGQSQFRSTGLDLSKAERVRPGSVYDLARCRVRRGDLVMPRSGAGSLGRNRVAVYERDDPATVSCFVDRIRLTGIRPHYVAVFLQSKPGIAQVDRAANGVGTVNISFEQVRRIQLPVLPDSVQREIERHARRARRVHSKAERSGADEDFRRAEAALARVIESLERRIQAPPGPD